MLRKKAGGGPLMGEKVKGKGLVSERVNGRRVMREEVKERGFVGERIKKGERVGRQGLLGAGARPNTRYILVPSPFIFPHPSYPLTPPLPSPLLSPHSSSPFTSHPPTPPAIYYYFLNRLSPREFRSTRGRKRASKK